MQVAVVSLRMCRSLSQHLRAAACCVFLLLCSTQSARAADNGFPIDAHLIAMLQVRAQQAQPRDQVQMYADLADKMTLLASRQLADGEEEAALKTLHELEACTALIESGLQADSRGLKKTEMLLHTTNRRLADMVRAGSGDVKPFVQTALKHLDKAQTALLGAVFEK